MGGRSSVWLCAGQTRIRADRLVAVEPAEGGLALHFTGMREPLHLPLAPEPGKVQDPGPADQLLSVIAYAAEYPAASLITYQAGDEYFVGGFTARTLTGHETIARRRLREPAPSLTELTASRTPPLNGPS
ncbi:hypothetical protein ABZ743_32415 [Streptomyces sp. NPDC006662]|uniref:hypothetical protein n=1 Tax=Streptomyces sp. NPDC006662 TaxID=3156902 RepID=UPI0033F2F733